MPILNLGIPEESYPEIDTKSGICVIVGTARCVWDDYSTVCGTPLNFDILCLNDMIMHFPDAYQHAFSNDDDLLSRWLYARRDQLRSVHPHPQRHSLRNWPWPGHGTSALGAVYTGLALGYDHVILAGCPLDGTGHYFDPPWVTSNHDKENIAHWQTARDKVFEGRVSSLSGRTRDILS